MDTQTYGRTATALFDTRAEATKAVEELVTAGIPRTTIRVSPESDVASSTTGTRTAYDSSRDEKGFWASLSDFFMPEDDRYTYAEAMNRGGILVSVSADGALADRAEDILEKHGTVNVDEREKTWRKEGWAGYSGTSASAIPGAAPSLGIASKSSTSKSSASAGTGGEQVVPEIEERLRVGKRQVSSGRVKVRSYVVERPVSEQVNLHTETVHVERRPVDRLVTPGDDAFRERTIEAVATSEEAVIAKEARVTGEVVVKKDATDRTKTVTDTVRSTKVEVEDNSATARKPLTDRR